MDYPPSWYAATANRTLDFPALDDDVSCDVAVVGGGYTGLSAAIALAERGFDVVLLEQHRIGWGASGRNGGQLIDGFVDVSKIEKRLGREAADIAWQMGIECRNLVVERIERYGIDCDLKFGYVDAAMNEAEMQDLRDDVEMRRARSYPHELRVIERDEMRMFIDSSRYIGGVLNGGNGHLHPLNLCLGEAAAAAGLGVRIFEHTAVQKIHHGDPATLQCARGRVRASQVVLGGNAYLGRTEPRIAGAVIPAGSFLIATEPLGDDRALRLLPADTAACDQRLRLDYFRLSADRRLLFGGLCNYSGLEPKSIRGVLQPNMLRVFPQLEGVAIDYEWGGDIGISINRIPQLGRIGANCWYAQGYSGHGLAPAHLAGVVLADAIGGDLERFDVFARIRHLRLPGGRWFANPALALGMIYYRLKELL